MQSNGSAIQTSDSKPVGNITSPTKKTPPKPPKRVSFNLQYRQIGEKPTKASPVDSPNPFTKLNGSLDENSNNSVNKTADTGNEQSSVNNLRKTSFEIEGDIDKNSDKIVSPAKVNTSICDTGPSSSDNKIRNKTVDKVEKNETSKQSKSDRLRLEFVKSSESPGIANPFSWANRNSEARSSFDSDTSQKSLSPNLQFRLSESQSKIAKLQQNLPKLSDATVDALKNKYSPASFGYPKSFIKSPTESKIPSLSPRSISTVKKAETETVAEEVKTDETTTEDNSKTSVAAESTGTLKRKQTFRTELFILPVGSEAEKLEKDNKQSLEENKSEKYFNSKAEDTQVKEPTVQTKLISSELFPEDQPVKDTTPVKDEQIVIKEECVLSQQKTPAEPVIIEDTSEQSSDTLTESEDSQNIKYRKSVINSDLDTTPSKLQDIENNNSTDIEDTSSYTSEITYCEIYEDELESALQESGLEMDDSKKKPQKKRSNSFKRIFGFGSSKDKKKDEKKKNEEEKTKSSNGLKKKDNMLSDNAQNEAHVFDRNTSQRHTIGGHYNSRNWERRELSSKENEPYYSNSNERYQVPRQQEQYSCSNYENSRINSNLPVLQRQHSMQSHQGHRIEDRLNKIQYDLLLAQQTNQQLNSNIPVNSPLHRNLDEYVCMDNTDKRDLTQPGFINAHHIAVDKYIDTTSSSSISTLESDTRNIIYENTVKANRVPKVSNNLNTKIPGPNSATPDKNVGNDSSPSIGEKCYERPKFADSPEIFTTTPKRAQGPQLIKPKAIIPINTERALPNPYRTIRDPQQPKSPEIRENLYGNLPAPENSRNESSLNSNKETVYGKPVPVARRNISPNETYGNVSSNDANITSEDVYGTVYDSLIPVAAQLKITKPPIINGGKNMEKRSRSVSPSQRHKAVNLSSSQSFTRKSRLPIQNSPTSPNSPLRKELEGTKLRLPPNREKLEPRLKSPIEERKNQRKTPEPVKKDNKNNIPSHQNLEIEIDYPDNNLNEIQDRKETPEKSMFSSDNEPSSPKRGAGLKRQSHVSPNRPKSFIHSTPNAARSPQTFRSDSPASVTSSHSMSSISTKSKPITTEDKKDLKNTEVYFYEQTTNQNIKKEDVSPDQSPQQVLTQATVHHPQSSPRRIEPKLEQPINSPRRTPVDHLQTVPASPQKAQNMQNVEAFYWQQIKKEHELYNQHLQMIARQNSMQVPQDYMQQHRSRSLSSGARLGQRRSTSLPRDVAPPNMNQRSSNDLYGYARTGRTVDPRQVTIPEGRPFEMNKNRNTAPDYGVLRQNMPSQNFVRGSPQRSTVGPISTQKRSQQQILHQQQQQLQHQQQQLQQQQQQLQHQQHQQQHQQDLIYENYYPGVELRHQAKSVQGSGGYAPIFKKGSLVPYQTSPQESPPQVNKKVSFSSEQSEQTQNWPTKNGFTQSPPTRRVDKKNDSMDDEVFLPENMQNIPPQMVVNLSKEPLYVSKPPAHPKDAVYVSNLGQREPMYGRTATNKQVTLTNKVCDMYGQIHETAPSIYGNIQKTGVIYGQLQQNPVPGSPASLRSQCRSDPCFVRGGRLTASFNDMRSDAPRRPLPPIPGSNSPLQKFYGRMNVPVSESESGSEAGEVQRILAQKERRRLEEEWNSDSKSGRSQSGGESGGRGGEADGEVRGGRGSRSGRRDDPRRHTLSGGGDHYPAGMAVQGGPLSRTMDLEVPMPRGYPPPSSAMLFDDDPGIMSEVETSSTGFRRGGKQRSSLPVVRTPSKTLERPLGLVFLQYRNETKRALLPNEITSIDTVKALFVRSFPKQLTMEYLDSPLVKIYIHDSSKDMFYELEDLRSHLRDIRDRSVLRLFESADISGGLPGPGTGISGGVGHFEDQSYFSEPEFDSEYQHQHIHKSKTSGAKGAPPYYMGSTTLPRGGPLLRAYSPAIGGPIPADRLKTLPTGAPPPPKPLRTYSGVAAAGGRFNTFHSQADLRLRSDNPLFSMPDRIHTDGYMSSPERGSRGTYEDPYYSQYATRSGSITPVIDEEASDTELLDESYSLYGVKLPPPGGPRAVPAPRTQFPPAPTAVPYDATRLRVENMERQLANLTGLVQKALHQNPTSTREFLQVPGGRDSYRTGDEFDKNSSSSSASLPDKSVSFEKSVSFSDEPPDMNSPKQHSPQHTADTKPPKPAIKSSTLPRTSSQERDRLKPAPPPKPASLSPAQYDNSRHIYRDLQLTPEMYNQLRGLQKKAKDLRTEVRNLRRLSQAQAHSVRETIKDTFIKIRAMLLASGEQVWQAGIDQEKLRLSREEDLYKQEMIRLEKDLTELESTVEELRGNVINRKTRVNMSDVENMALILSKSSKTVADLKLRFPGLQDAMKNLLSSEMEKVVREEKFLKEEPERLESALRRCKKLTGTLVTLKRLASVQEQRLPCANNAGDGQLSPSLTETPPITPPSAQHSKPPAVPASRTVLGQSLVGGDSGGGGACDGSQRPENALDALLDELQTFSKPHSVSANPTPAPSTVTTQLPQAASYKVPGTGSGTPSMAEIGRKGSMDSATLLPVQNLTVSTATGSLRRLHSYPSGSDTDNSPPIQPLQRADSRGATSANKPPIPERNAELLQHLASGRRVPPPPPPRTSSKSPLASPTSPSLPPRSQPNQNPLQHIQNVQNMTDKPQSQFEAATQNLGLGTLRRNVPGRSSLKEKSQTLPRNIGSNLQVQTNTDGPENKLNPMSTSNSSSCESVNSQEGAKKGSRKEELEQRHQELLKKQKALQEQYARLQQLQRGNNTLTVVPPAPDLLLKKTGSESNLLQKMGLQMAAPQQMTGSLTHLANASLSAAQQAGNAPVAAAAGDKTPAVNAANSNSTTSKVYETDIL